MPGDPRLGIGGLGGWLLVLGGSPYYLVAGLAMLLSGMLIATARIVLG